MAIQILPYGTTKNGQAVEAITLSDGKITAEILTYGGAIAQLIVPDQAGNPVDVVLGYDDMAGWECQNFFLNALIGRCGNRIAGGKFTLDGVSYTLATNNGPNSLHGGNIGFDKKIWSIKKSGENYVTLHLDSPHLDEGFPGNLSVDVTYTVENSALAIHYQATTDQKTICNLTNHAYFNLAGHASGSAMGQILQLNASCFTPADDTSIPTGALASVIGTPMDFLTPTVLGDRIEDDFQQLIYGQGYDHNWVVDGAHGTLRRGAMAHCMETGITMTMDTTNQAVQLYTGNFVTDTPIGKGGAIYGRRHGFCLETQCVPDAIHYPQFVQPVLDVGEVYDETTIYRFG